MDEPGGPVRDGTAALLYPQAASASFGLEVRPPSPALAGVVQEYWVVRWDRRGLPPFTQRLLSSPNVNLTLKRGRSRVAGLTTGVFTEVVEDRHVVFGVRFRPGGFRPFLHAPVSTITDRFVPVGDVFGPGGVDLEAPVLAATTTDAMVERIEDFLLARLPEADPAVDLAAGLVAAVAGDPGLTRVDQLARRADLSPRRLQQIFAAYIGAGPKWVIRRYRLQEAATRAAHASGRLEWAALAHDLGYSDQAHLIRDFTATIGLAPSAYARGCARA